MLKLNSFENNIFFSSDIHGYHKNITYGTSNWDNKETSTRRFDNPVKMTDVIINNINNLVLPDDHLFLLGDLLFHKKQAKNYYNFINRFNCNNIYLLYGNHCSRENLKSACNINSKIKFIGDYLEIIVDKQMLCLFHYPIAKWNNRHKTSWHLFGHEHGTYDNCEKSIDVGIDNYYKLFGEYKPFSWEEIKEKINNN